MVKMNGVFTCGSRQLDSIGMKGLSQLPFHANFKGCFFLYYSGTKWNCAEALKSHSQPQFYFHNNTVFFLIIFLSEIRKSIQTKIKQDFTNLLLTIKKKNQNQVYFVFRLS